MGSHRGSRVNEGGAVLDLQTVNGVCIVAAPDLRRIVQHACVKTSAASAASLDENIRIPVHQPLQEIIEPQHIVVEHPPLAVRRGGIDVRKAPVISHFTYSTLPWSRTAQIFS